MHKLKMNRLWKNINLTLIISKSRLLKNTKINISLVWQNNILMALWKSSPYVCSEKNSLYGIWKLCSEL